MTAAHGRRIVDIQASGVLWAINRVLMHPRGFALGHDPETGEFVVLGNGSEPWSFTEADDDDRFAAFEASLQEWRAERDGAG